MAKFCGKCGAKLDERTGLCPNCDGVPEMEKKAEPVPPVRSAPVTPQPAGQRLGRFCGRCGGPVDPQTGRCPVCDGAARYTPPVDVSSTMPPSAGNPAQTGDRDDVKKAHSATAASGRKSSRLIVWLLLGLLAIVVIGGLAYFRMIPLKFVNDAAEKVESLLGIEPYEGRKVSRETAYDDSGKRLWYHEYAYGADGRLASVTSYDGNGQQTAHIEMQYDGQGRELTWWMESSGSVVIYATVQYASPTVRRLEYTAGDGVYHMQTLDDNGKVLEDRYYREGGILIWTEYYVYDAKGRLTEIRTETSEDSDVLNLYSLTTYEYSGRTETKNRYYTEYEYDSAIQDFVQTGESWLIEQSVSEYNGRGDRTSWTLYQRGVKDTPLEEVFAEVRHYAFDGTCTGYENFDGNGNRTRYTTREFLSLWESMK